MAPILFARFPPVPKCYEYLCRTQVFEGKNVILNTPTGSGKSLVAAAMHYGRRVAHMGPLPKRGE